MAVIQDPEIPRVGGNTFYVWKEIAPNLEDYFTRSQTNGLINSATNPLSNRISALENKGVSYGTLGGTTSAFTVSIDGVTLTHGTVIVVYNAIGNGASKDSTLNVNNLGAKPIYYNASVGGSYLRNKTVQILMYNTAIVSTGCWQLVYSYDSNTTTGTETNIEAGTSDTKFATRISVVNYIEDLLGDIPDRVESLETGAVTIDSSYSTLSALQSALTTLSPHKIYLIPASGNGTNNAYDEYIVKNGALEKIGTKELSLNGYFKTADFKSTLYNSVTSIDCTTAHVGVDGATEDAINIKINFAD